MSKRAFGGNRVQVRYLFAKLLVEAKVTEPCETTRKIPIDIEDRHTDG
jgi:hypothetical protein